MQENQGEAGAAGMAEAPAAAPNAPKTVKKWVRLPDDPAAHRLIEGQAAALRAGADPAAIAVLPAPLTGGTTADLAAIVGAIGAIDRKMDQLGGLVMAIKGALEGLGRVNVSRAKPSL